MRANSRFYAKPVLTMACIAALAAVGLFVVLALSGSTARSSAQAQRSDMTSSALTSRSDDLTQAPTLSSSISTGDASRPASDLRAAAESISNLEIPLPPGLDTAATLDWPKQAEQGPLTDNDIRALLQANAARDWLWFATHNQLSPDQRRIVSQIPQWSALRGNALGELYSGAINRALAGTDPAGSIEFAANQFKDKGGAPPADPTW